MAAALLGCVMVSGCTVIKPVACATVFPFQKIAKDMKTKDDGDEHSKLPTAGVIVAAPVLIPLKYVYYVSYGLVGGLVSGVVNDLNMLTGHGSIRNSNRTMFRPLRTNAVR